MSIQQVELDPPPTRRDDLSFPEEDAPSISSPRIHNTGAHVAPFNAPSWPLAALDSGNSPSRTIHFGAWPHGFQTFARHVAYVLINYGMPEALVEQHRSTAVRWPSSGSIANILHRLRGHAVWLATEWSESHPDTPIEGPHDVDSHHLDDLRAWIEVRYVEARSRGANLAEVVRVWHLNPWLPDDCQWPDPKWRHHGWQPKRGKEENKSLPLNESTFGPLLEWAIAFVTNFAPDIVSAHRHYAARTSVKTVVGLHRTAGACLDQYAKAATALPPRPTYAGGRAGNRVGWHVMEYRHSIPSESFASSFRGIRKASLQISEDVSLTAIDVPVTGQFRGRPWIPFVGVYDMNPMEGGGRLAVKRGPLIGHLRTACLIVVAALTGMRPDEVLGLQHGCADEPIPRPGGSRLQLVQGHVFKGVGRLENGAPDVPHPAVWATIPVTADAIRIAEQVNEILGRTSGHLFGETGSVAAHTGAAARWIESFVEFVNARLVPHTATPAALTIQADPDGPISLRRFRRTLAWYLRHRPNGDVTTAIQYQHVGVAMGEGYAGTKASGVPDLLLEEDWNHRADTIRQLGGLLSDGGGVGGPAAKRALEATQRLPRHLGPADERRLRKDKSLLVYDNPAALALCIYDEQNALCQKLRSSGKDTQPDLLGCIDGCLNSARRDDHVVSLKNQARALRTQAQLVPLPMAQSMAAQAERNDRVVAEIESTRITLGADQSTNVTR